jgi:formylglycine-generating enzyme required for sulfatase activity
MGNVWEWNETLISGSTHGIRGGSYYTDYGRYGPVGALASSGRGGPDPYYEVHDIGFRVASIPEPCSLALLFLGGLVLRGRKK